MKYSIGVIYRLLYLIEKEGILETSSLSRNDVFKIRELLYQSIKENEEDKFISPDNPVSKNEIIKNIIEGYSFYWHTKSSMLFYPKQGRLKMLIKTLRRKWTLERIPNPTKEDLAELNNVLFILNLLRKKGK